MQAQYISSYCNTLNPNITWFTCFWVKFSKFLDVKLDRRTLSRSFPMLQETLIPSLLDFQSYYTYFPLFLSLTTEHIGNKKYCRFYVTADIAIDCHNYLTHFQPMFHFYTPWKHHKIGGFLMFSGGIEVEHWLKMR